MTKLTQLFALLIAATLLSSSTATVTEEEELLADQTEIREVETNILADVETNAKRIFIDPGHGGNDPGAPGIGFNEADKNLDIAKRLGAVLQSRGYQVKYSRTSSVSVSLAARAQMANDWGADLFISIHGNAFSNPQAHGTETYHHPNGSSTSRTLASRINNALVSKMGLTNRGVKSSNFAVLRLTQMPAVLVETAFVTNPGDANLLKNNPQGFANAIASGV